ncbi:hypothetical protein [Pandoraea sp. NPDC087047]|uniref:hypothetical protein n=1 Tax=Pandoraea sp. NPDC087047 TaxID=3364390 RepID=UPI0037F49093
METLARKVIKTLLFVFVWFLAIRYIDVPLDAYYDVFVTMYVWAGTESPEDFYIAAQMILQLIAAVIIYNVCIHLFRALVKHRVRDDDRNPADQA